MSLSVLNNTASLQAQTALNNTNNNLSTSLQRLSTGLKINSGADGPAAYVISQEQSAQIAGLNTAINNTNEAVSVVQVGEGALNQVSSLLTQVRSLALDSANSGVDDSNALAANQAQISNALSTIDRIATNTQFGTKPLLDGSAGYNAITTNTGVSSLNAASTTTLGSYAVAITQGAQKGQVSVAAGTPAAGTLSNSSNLSANENLTFGGSAGSGTVSLTAGETNTQVAASINAETSQTGVVASLDATSGDLVLTAQNFGQNFTVTSDTAAGAGSTGIGTTTLNTSAGAAGAVTLKGQNLTGTLTGPSATVTNFTGNGNVVDITAGQANGLSFTVNPDATNAAKSDATVTSSGANLEVQNGTLQFQIGANEGQTASLSIAKTTTDALGTGVANDQFSSLKQINVTTASGAQDALKVIDAAISQVANQNATLGAFQTNTLQANAANLQSTLTNTTAAQAVVSNTDFASEISNYTKLQTQLQAGSSVLSNANQTTSLISNLLQRA